MTRFTVNGKEYVAKPFDFNLVCDLEDMGVSMEEAGKKPMTMLRAYFALCAGKGKVFAGKEMEAHAVNGGSLKDLTDAMSREMERSGFFQALNQKSKEPSEEKKEGEAL